MLASTALGLLLLLPSAAPVATIAPISDLFTSLKSGRVESVELRGQSATWIDKSTGESKTSEIPLGLLNLVAERSLASSAVVSSRKNSGALTGALVELLSLGLAASATALVYRWLSSPSVRTDTHQPSVLKFQDVAGLEETKAELADVVRYLCSPKKFYALGAAPPKGILLEGPSGTGKTLIGRALAGEAGVPFFYAAASQVSFLESHYEFFLVCRNIRWTGRWQNSRDFQAGEGSSTGGFVYRRN